MTNNTPAILGKTVWILGAGASAHAGIPLLKDFIVKSRLLYKGRNDLKGKDRFEIVFKWVDELRGAAYYTDLDLDNLEHLFSMAEMLRQTQDGPSRLWDAIRLVVLETIEKSASFVGDGRNKKYDSVYSSFVQNLRELRKIRKTRVGGNTGSFESDVVISFNYDTLLDESFYAHDDPPNYGLDDLGVNQAEAREEKGFHFLKLHGSLNWGKCTNPDPRTFDEHEKIQIIQLSPTLQDGFSNFSIPKNDQHVEFRLVDKLDSLKCSICGQAKSQIPLIIPPTWSKLVERKAMARVWAAAINELQTASQIIVVGYSMPQTDTFFQYLLALGLKSNSDLHRIVIVNKVCDSELKQRYQKVFSKSLLERGRIRFVESDFEKFVVGKVGSSENMLWYGEYLSNPPNV